MTESTAPTNADTQPHPFNPDLPKLFANFTTWWNTIPEDDKEEVTPLFEFYLPLEWLGEPRFPAPYPKLPGVVYIKGWHTITYGHVLELVRRDAYAEKTRAELAEKCATYRGRAEEAESVARVLASVLRLGGATDAKIAAVLRSIGMFGELPAYLGGAHSTAAPAAPPVVASFDASYVASNDGAS